MVGVVRGVCVRGAGGLRVDRAAGDSRFVILHPRVFCPVFVAHFPRPLHLSPSFRCPTTATFLTSLSLLSSPSLPLPPPTIKKGSTPNLPTTSSLPFLPTLLFAFCSILSSC